MTGRNVKAERSYPSGQPFRDWVDFYDRVVVPYVNADDTQAHDEAVRLFRTASPEFILAAFYFARISGP